MSQKQATTPLKQLNIQKVIYTPPVFTGFEVYANDENGFFIIFFHIVYLIDFVLVGTILGIKITLKRVPT